MTRTAIRRNERPVCKYHESSRPSSAVDSSDGDDTEREQERSTQGHQCPPDGRVRHQGNRITDQIAESGRRYQDALGAAGARHARRRGRALVA